MTLDRRFALNLALTIALVAVVAPGIPAAAQTFTVLHYFTGGADGAIPTAALTVGPSGVVYGATASGGIRNNGTVFKLSQDNSGWVFSTLYQFTGPSDGGTDRRSSVWAGRQRSRHDQIGGTDGDGVVFSLRPPATLCRSVTCYWNETVLHTFTGSPDGFNPWTEKLAFDAAGNIYGTTGNGGTVGGGTAFELTPSGGGYTETILHSFGSRGDGWAPFGGVVLDDGGNVYERRQAVDTSTCAAPAAERFTS